MSSSTVNKTVLSNGIRVLTKHVPHIRSVSMGVWVNVGARDEAPNDNGLSHFIEHMLFKGTKNRSAFDIAKEFDAIGGHTNAFTSMENTCFHAKVLDTHLSTMVDILSDIFLNSEFKSKEIDVERPIILSEIGMLEDSPEELVHTLSESQCWGPHSLGRSILGTPENVAKFNRNNIKAFIKNHYLPDQIIISAAGNIDHDSLIDQIAPEFERVKKQGNHEPRIKPEMLSGIHYLEKDLEQVHLCIAMPGISLRSEERFAYSLLNTMMGGNMSSRLFQTIREEHGLAYSIYSFTSSNEDSGLFGVYTSVSPETLEKTASLIFSELEKFCTKGITDSELNNAKEYTKGNILLASESTDNQMVRLAQSEYHYQRYVSVNEIIDHISKVTVEDVLSLADRMFVQAKPTITLLGPCSDITQLKGYAE